MQETIASENLPEPPAVVPFEQALEIVRDVSRMHAHYRDYSVATALAILKALPGARADHEYSYDDTARRWGPGRIAKHMGQSQHSDLTATTVSRYLKAWWLLGLRAVEIDGESIPIPYHPRGPSK